MDNSVNKFTDKFTLYLTNSLVDCKEKCTENRCNYFDY
jgi:hypothetical protein